MLLLLFFCNVNIDDSMFLSKRIYSSQRNYLYSKLLPVDQYNSNVQTKRNRNIGSLLQWLHFHLQYCNISISYYEVQWKISWLLFLCLFFVFLSGESHQKLTSFIFCLLTYFIVHYQGWGLLWANLHQYFVYV